mmetsp:Transcript_126254/g.252201  ORF Transcript_126254/g.252201 Transcript_126254/m.252201 type:complete len:223 (-) Transcript_126254:119-787(-)
MHRAHFQSGDFFWLGSSCNKCFNVLNLSIALSFCHINVNNLQRYIITTAQFAANQIVSKAQAGFHSGANINTNELASGRNLSRQRLPYFQLFHGVYPSEHFVAYFFPAPYQLLQSRDQNNPLALFQVNLLDLGFEFLSGVQQLHQFPWCIQQNRFLGIDVTKCPPTPPSKNDCLNLISDREFLKLPPCHRTLHGFSHSSSLSIQIHSALDAMPKKAGHDKDI